MTQIFEGSIQASIGFNPTDLDQIKDQVEKLLFNLSGKPVGKVQIETFVNKLQAPMILGVMNAGIWIANRASEIAPIKTGRLRASGSVWVNGDRIFITGGGTHPDSIDTPELTAIIIFNAPYAFEQDTRNDFRHPIGGQAGYLTETMERKDIIQEIMTTPLKAAFGQ